MLRRVDSKLEERVRRAAEAALSENQYVSPIDVLCGMGLLASSHVDSWRKGRIEVLEEVIQGSSNKIYSSLAIFHEWAKDQRLKPVEASYVRPKRDGTVALRFSKSGDPELERLYRAHFVPAALPERKQQRLQEKLNKLPQPVVFQILRDSKCSECGVELEEASLLLMEANQPLCLACAHMDDLEYLPSGDAALTRRSTKYSSRVAVVVRFSRSRGRYERQGILVENAALEKAEQECTADADERAAARMQGAARRVKDDRGLVERMVTRISALFPRCPPAEVKAIAEHTALRGSGRVGRTEAGRNLDEEALTAAVRAAVRHKHTEYDELLANGMDRDSARRRVADRVDDILSRWRT